MPDHLALAAKRDTGTVIVACDGWRAPHFRVHSCGHAYQLDPERHDHFDWSAMRPLAQVRVVLRGTAVLSVGESSRTLGRGGTACLILPARDLRVHAAELPLEYLWVQLTGQPALGLLAEATREVGVAQQIDPAGPAVRSLRRLIRAAADDRVGRGAFEWSDLVYDVLSKWWREMLGAEARRAAAARGVAGRPLPDELARRPPDRLESPVSSAVLARSPRTVKELAARLGYSRSHLSGVISRSWHEPPGRVLRRDRMQLAAEMLAQGHSVTATARACGYASHQTFSRAFRRHFGHLPSKAPPTAGG